MKYRTEINRNPDRYSELKYEWFIYCDDKLIEHGLSVSKKYAKKDINDTLKQLKGE